LLGLTRKKSLRAAEQDRADIAAARTAWRKLQLCLNPARLIFIDETWTETNMTRAMGCTERSKRLLRVVPHGPGRPQPSSPRYPLIAGPPRPFPRAAAWLAAHPARRGADFYPDVHPTATTKPSRKQKSRWSVRLLGCSHNACQAAMSSAGRASDAAPAPHKRSPSCTKRRQRCGALYQPSASTHVEEAGAA
jgi:hypothetical protein